MVTCQTSQWGNNYSPYVKLTVREASETGSSITLIWILECVIVNGDFSKSSACPYTVSVGGETVANSSFALPKSVGTHHITSGSKVISKTTAQQTIPCSVSFSFNLTWNGVYNGTSTASTSVTVAKKTTYTVYYDADGGTGAPSGQTKLHDTALPLSTVKPTRTGYSFVAWTDGSKTYQPGDSYTTNANLNLTAVWKANTYSVKYDANKGTGAPEPQTKTYGVPLKLSNVIPTRENYTFLGWGTAVSSITPTYQPGDNYTKESAARLYAVWELSYVKPRILNSMVDRCDVNGNATEDGTYAMVSFLWYTDRPVSTIEISWTSETGGSGTTKVTASGVSGMVNQKIGNGALSVDSTYTITIRVGDTVDSTYVFETLAGTNFAIDVYREAKGIAFGKPAEVEGLCDINFKTRFKGGLLPVVLPAESDLNTVLTPNTYIGANITEYDYTNCPVDSGTFTLIVESCGEHGQIRQTFISCDRIKPQKFVRFYYLQQWYEWAWSGEDEIILYNSSGGAGTITLNQDVSMYRYIEIYYTDNNGIAGGYAKVYSPNGKTISLGLQEAAASSVLFRQTKYTISGTKMTPELTNASYIQYVKGNTAFSNSFGTNYLRIVRVIGRA